MPTFEFYSSSKVLNENRIFLRDLKQRYYHAGLESVGRDIHEVAYFLKKEIEILKPDRVVFVGCSMGGFAAILFASLVGFGEVIAFCPQTFISPWLRFRHGDNRWRGHVIRTYGISLFKSKAWNLRPLVAKAKGRLKLSIYVCSKNSLDCIHAKHLAGLPNVQIYTFPKGGHFIAKYLKKEGYLPAILAGTYVHTTEV
ncbi:MAG: hypothetical protein IGQ88_05410 [Gloeomargaritaceae cyanobacterium C42_A2020_066]|nr:hypothetical protein [Gloeomargaritaceae cyanobacterium C42_A2020_066]